jgi:3-phenylpropionate/trans-cinnamate dioxygenase ferredoxin reductase subunit
VSVVVVGASLAGATTALTVRELGYDGPVVLVGAEAELPYERPELSKAYLAGRVVAEELVVRPRAAYDESGIELRTGERAVGLDLEHRLVRLHSGERLPYTRLVLATGAENVRPPIPGLEKEWVHQLRTLQDANRLRQQLRRATTAVVVGMGFIGCEVAATLNGLGLEVTAVDMRPGPLWDVLGPELSHVVRSWHEERGVCMRTGTSVEAITPDRHVHLTDGRAVAADVVVVGAGVRPNTGWLQGVPLHLVGGAVGVDARGRTSQPHVYAAGDVCAVWSPETGTHHRTEHWAAAVDQGQRVAREIAGCEALAPAAPYFWSTQHGHHLQYVGRREPGADVVRRPDETTFFLSAGVLTGAVTVNNGRDLRRAMHLLGRRVGAAALADPERDLRELARSA